MPVIWPQSHPKPGLIGLVFILLISTLLLFWGGPEYHATRSTKAIWNLGHVLYFALITYLLIGWRPLARLAVLWRWLVILAFTFSTGLLIEVLQYGIQRTPDMGDVMRDMTGAALMLSFGPGHRDIRSRSISIGLQGMALVLLLIQLWTLALALIDEVNAWREFPRLAGFETPFELSRWQGKANLSITDARFSTTGRVLRIELGTQRYSGISLEHFPRNWLSFTSLSMRLYNPLAEPLWITCRIHDLAHEQGEQHHNDRFNRRYLLEHGWNQIIIELTEVASAPRNRRLDLAQVGNLGLFANALHEPRTIYLDEVRLNH